VLQRVPGAGQDQVVTDVLFQPNEVGPLAVKAVVISNGAARLCSDTHYLHCRTELWVLCAHANTAAMLRQLVLDVQFCVQLPLTKGNSIAL
jgi:hypothetical protein